MNILITSINYKIDKDGNTSGVNTSFTGIENGATISANVPLLADDLTEGETFDDLTRKQIEALGRKKLAKLTEYTE